MTSTDGHHQMYLDPTSRKLCHDEMMTVEEMEYDREVGHHDCSVLTAYQKCFAGRRVGYFSFNLFSLLLILDCDSISTVQHMTSDKSELLFHN